LHIGAFTLAYRITKPAGAAAKSRSAVTWSRNNT